MPNSSPSVLIIRLDAIGDALALAPLLAALRACGADVDLVLRPGNAEIFAPRAARRVVTSRFDLRSGDASTLHAIAALGNELARERYTHVLVATEDPGGYRLAGATRAPVRIGFTNTWGKPFKALWARRFLTQSIGRRAGLDPRAPHECEVLFRLGRSLVGDVDVPRDPALLRPLVLEHEPEPDDRTVVQITDKWERLGIAFDDVVDLVARARSRRSLRLIAARSEDGYAVRLADATGAEVERFERLEPWKAAIAAAPALIAPDSGALHVAGMVGTPAVAVFPPIRDFALQVARWAPWAAPHRIVRADPGWPGRVADALEELP